MTVAARWLVVLLSIAFAGGLLFYTNQQHLKPVVNRHTLVVDNPTFYRPDLPDLQIAVISDLHVEESEAAYQALDSLIDEIVAEQPGIVVLLGDYTTHPERVADMTTHRERVVDALSRLTVIPTVAVLGNYETWSELSAWRRELNHAGVRVLHDEVLELQVAEWAICFRGLGDAFTQQYEYVRFPASCTERPKITLTHDPAAAFKPDIEGVVLAGHTHCGQVRLPALGVLWIPSDAPKAATCGEYKDRDRLLWVSAGVGTSILPIRLGVQAQWDLLTVAGKLCYEFLIPPIGDWHQSELCMREIQEITRE